MPAYYNENDSFAAAWLRELIKRDLIAAGDVDVRSIVEVQPGDLKGYSQCHFFAGIGGWSYALRLAGWPDDRSVWTGSCPCQPFSAAGQRKGFSDARHLWPVWMRLISECRPLCLFGEQVASALQWLDLVSGDLESEDYAVGAAIVGAHSVGAPHQRQRIYWVADASVERRQQISGRTSCNEKENGRQSNSNYQPSGDSEIGDVANTAESRRPRAGQHDGRPSQLSARLAEYGSLVVADTQSQHDRSRNAGTGRRAELADSCGLVIPALEQVGIPRRAWESGSSLAKSDGRDASTERQQRSGKQRLIAPHSWSMCDWLPCIDGKSRPVEPKYVALVDGLSRAMGLDCAQFFQEGEKVNASVIDQDGEGSLRALWKKKLQAPRSSQGPEPHEQRDEEFTDFVRLLPSSYALAQLHRDGATEKALLTLLQACGAERLVQHSFKPIEETWQSFSKEVQNCIRLGFETGCFVRTVEHPLVHGSPSRVGRLRGYGNAIVPQVAAAFVSSYLDLIARPVPSGTDATKLKEKQ